MSQTSCMGSTATKLCAVTWLVEALGPHKICTVAIKKNSCLVYVNPQVSLCLPDTAV